MYRLATKCTAKKRTEKNVNVSFFETAGNQACTIRVTFCYLLTSWTTELWSVTLIGHAWV